MRRLINGKIRNTDKMKLVVSKEGNPSDCYSMYNRIMLDERDGTHYLWQGHFWGGISPDSLSIIESVPDVVSGKTCEYGISWDLSKDEAAYLESLIEQEETP
jgi:hypothetical protein